MLVWGLWARRASLQQWALHPRGLETDRAISLTPLAVIAVFCKPQNLTTAAGAALLTLLFALTRICRSVVKIAVMCAHLYLVWFLIGLSKTFG